MSHWIIVPVILPAILAPFIVLAARYHIGIQRVFSVAGVLALVAIAASLAWTTSDGSVLLYQLGDWAAPFGSVVVGGRNGPRSLNCPVMLKRSGYFPVNTDARADEHTA